MLRLQHFVSEFRTQVPHIKNYVKYPYIIFNAKTNHNGYFQTINNNIINSGVFNNHQLIALSTDSRYQCIFAVFIHQVNRGPASGGVRYLQYDSLDDIVYDGLRLSEGMSRKSALAGLHWGGGKGIIAYEHNRFLCNTIARRELFEDYGKFISSLNGIYHTAGDVGTNTQDIDYIYNQTRYVSCIDIRYGGTGNPSYFTAKGVITCLKEITNLKDSVITMQGLGDVSRYMIDMLIKNDVQKIYVCDTNQDVIQQYFQDFKSSHNVYAVKPEDIYKKPSDIFIPNALGGTINKHTIPLINARIICGAANNQLSEDKDAELLLQHRKIWIPDFIVNRMGLVNCANENYGKLHNDPEIKKHYSSTYKYSLINTIKVVHQIAMEENCTISTAANFLADGYIKQKHPIYNNRFNDIISYLTKRHNRILK